jgi:Gas vesicle synthesis protein GvpL/GvpF.
MAVHLYGGLDAAAAPAPSVAGLDGRPVRVLSLGNRYAWVSDTADPRLEATPKRIREHDTVLRAAIDAGYSVVPSLFGRLHADDRAVIAALEQSAGACGYGHGARARSRRDEPSRRSIRVTTGDRSPLHPLRRADQVTNTFDGFETRFMRNEYCSPRQSN